MNDVNFAIKIPFNGPLEICKNCDHVDLELDTSKVYFDDKVLSTNSTAYCKNRSLCRYIAERLEEKRMGNWEFCIRCVHALENGDSYYCDDCEIDRRTKPSEFEYDTKWQGRDDNRKEKIEYADTDNGYD